MAQQKAKATASGGSEAHPRLKLDAAECMEVLTSWNLSMLNFYVERAQAYWAVPGELPGPLSVEDGMATYERFLETMVADYAAQAKRLSQLIPARGDGSASDAETGYEQGLLKAQADAAQIIEQAKRQAERIVANAEKRAKAATSDSDAAGKRQPLKKSA